MTKKAYILTLLTSLESSRPVARWLRVLVEHNTLDDQTIVSLKDMFASAINSVDVSITKQKLAQSIVIMQKIKEAEIEHKKQDDQEITELEEMIKSI